MMGVIAAVAGAIHFHFFISIPPYPQTYTNSHKLAITITKKQKEVCVVSDLEFVATFNSLPSDKQELVIGEIEKLLASQSRGKHKEDTQDE